MDNLLQSDRATKTMFTEWFTANQTYPRAKNLTYVEFPQQFVWDSSGLIWTERKRNYLTLGRLPYAHLTSGDKFYLRILLTKKRGAVGFQDLRTVDGILHQTFRSACIAPGLVGDDNEWSTALTEISHWGSPRQICELFSIILMFSEATNPRELWNKFWKTMADDYQWLIEKINPNLQLQLSEQQLQDHALHDINSILFKNGNTLSDFPNMPLPCSSLHLKCKIRLLLEELAYNHDQLSSLSCKLKSSLNHEQLTVYEKIIQSCMNNQGKTFFVYGGGTGKTFLWKALISYVRSQKKIVLPVASSGIASLLLPGGQTAHSRYKILIDVTEISSCSISCQSQLADLIRETTLIIWNEAPMTSKSKYVFDAVDRSFKDIMKTADKDAAKKNFGGKTIILGGDFRQMLPVVQKGSLQDIIAATIHKSTLWKTCELFTFKRKMLLQQITELPDINEQNEFAKWIIDIGDGGVHGIHENNDDGGTWIKIPADLLIDPTKGFDGLVSVVYPDLECNTFNANYFKSLAILACTNEEVDHINNQILEKLPGEMKQYVSADTKIDIGISKDEDPYSYTQEFLNSLEYLGIPSHALHLKIAAPIMLLRNLN